MFAGFAFCFGVLFTTVLMIAASFSPTSYLLILGTVWTISSFSAKESMSSNSFFNFSISVAGKSDDASGRLVGIGIEGEMGSSRGLFFASKLFLLPTLLLPCSGLTVLGGVLVGSEGCGELIMFLRGELV